jgi:hypothetical protein
MAGDWSRGEDCLFVLVLNESKIYPPPFTKNICLCPQISLLLNLLLKRNHIEMNKFDVNKCCYSVS